MAFEILHFADLHLDTSFAPGSVSCSDGAWRRADLRTALGRILALGRERKVDAITIAGDLYEQEYALPETGEFLAQQFARLAPIRVFIAPGQSDPMVSRSLYDLTRWPGNVSIFRQGQLNCIHLSETLALWGSACPSVRDHQRLLDVAMDRQGTNLLLLHAADEQQSTDNGLFAVGTTMLREFGFDFALLGSEHLGRLWPSDHPIAVFPGSPEPLMREHASGQHCAVLLTVDENQVAPELIDIGQWRYHDVTVDLTDCANAEVAATQVIRAIARLTGRTNERTILRILLTGLCEFDLDVSGLRQHLDLNVHVEFDTRLSMPYELDMLAEEQTVRGLLLRRFRERIAATDSDQDRRVALNALHLALRALDGKQVVSYEIT